MWESRTIYNSENRPSVQTQLVNLQYVHKIEYNKVIKGKCKPIVIELKEIHNMGLR